MHIRFREYNKDTNKYKLLAYTDIPDYDVAFKMFTFMKEHECEFAISIANDVEDINETLYNVIDVSFVAPNIGSEILLHIAVDLEEAL